MKRRTFCASGMAAIVAATTSGSVLAAVAEALGPISADVSGIGLDGKALTLPKSAVEDFRRRLRGLLLTRSDAGYDQARRVWNGAFDRHPALIARCTGAADVAHCVDFARANGLLVAVRGGGHSLSGQSVCEGGLMIDLAPMKGVRVDPSNRTARAEPGVLLGEFDREAQHFGLATTAGTVSHTGIAGLTLGGGFGRLGRKYGLTIDNLKSVDLVTADGRFLTASAADNADLFWAVRGGGGNFGVVTSFEYDLHKVGPTLFGGKLVFPLAQAREVLNFFAGYIEEFPDELYMEAILAAPANADRALVFDVCYCGDPAGAERIVRPLREFRRPLADSLAPTSYVDLQRGNDALAVPGRSYYTRSGYIRNIERGLIDDATALIEAAPLRPTNVFIVGLGGGAVGRVKPADTAFYFRDARHSLILQMIWTNHAEADERMGWARSNWPALERYTKGAYSNVVTMDHTRAQVAQMYGGNLGRLVELKRRYDPTNLFRLNANIPPAA